MISVRSNTYYSQDENHKEFELNPMLELIMIYADGKDWKLTPKGLSPQVKVLSEQKKRKIEKSLNIINNKSLHSVKKHSKNPQNKTVSKIVSKS